MAACRIMVVRKKGGGGSLLTSFCISSMIQVSTISSGVSRFWSNTIRVNSWNSCSLFPAQSAPICVLCVSYRHSYSLYPQPGPRITLKSQISNLKLNSACSYRSHTALIPLSYRSHNGLLTNSDHTIAFLCPFA